MRKPKLRELKEAITALFKGPYTIKFPKVPSPPFPTYRGRAKFREEECVGCGACSKVCPSQAIKLVDMVEEDKRSGVRRLIYRWDKCIFCGECERNCITQKGIYLTQEYDLAVLNREEATETVEKELLLCEHCGEIIGARDHLRWLVKEKLKEKTFSNPTLFLSSHQELELIPSLPGEEVLPRSKNLKILCPRCRRLTYLEEEWGTLPSSGS